MGLVFTYDYQVPFYETTVNQEIKLPHLLSLCLQISGLQSLDLGVSDDYIFKTYNLIWVVTDYEIDIKRLPSYAENIRIETEAISYNKLFTYRDFRIFSEEGDLLLTIRTTFVLMDYTTRKVSPILDELVAAYQPEKAKKMQRAPKYQVLENLDLRAFQARFSDLDMNGHVNNSKYLEWILDDFEHDFLKAHSLTGLHIKFIKEIAPASQVGLRSQLSEDLVSRHDILVDGNLHAQAQVKWQQR